ncbi:SCO3933 family regulatory protein [Streptacidiphilus melanogenes]|uniref:SCO3933 family regulatory protein n=1 Tax=Streptacidiphilus melanogenes TaxID=411235 RepID=UPI0005A96548|nr:hypothetical protein [Streptacidiphilus melanogenes]
MARITVRPDLTGVTHIVAVPPTVKVKDMETGEIAVDRDGKTRLFTVQLMETFGLQAQVIKVTVPETGLIDGLALGAIVRPVGLIASPWGNAFGGQVTVGLAYRAESLELANPTAAPAKAEAAAK